MDGWVERRIDRWIDGLMDRYMDDGPIDRWMEEYVPKSSSG